MRTLVVYYSFEGNTEYAAKRIAERLSAHLLKLQPEVEPPKNALKFLFGGRAALMGAKVGLNPFDEVPSEYDRIVIGSPVWAGREAPAVREFLLGSPFEGKEVALFACSAGGDASGMLMHLKGALAGNEVIGELSLKSPLKNREEADAQIDAFCREISENRERAE